MKLMGRTVLIACLALSPRLLGQGAISLSQQDLDAAQWEYSGVLTINKPAGTLYDAPKIFPDGARGYFFSQRTDVGVGYGHDPQVNSLKLMRAEYCAANLIVVASDVAETTVLSLNKGAVFTVTQFRIERILKDDNSHKIGDLVTFVHFGGTYRDAQGNVLRVAADPARPYDRPYRKGNLYLLQLIKARNQNYPSSVYFGGWDQIKIEDGHIFPTKRVSDSPKIPNPARYGESLDTYWKRLTGYLGTAPCASR